MDPDVRVPLSLAAKLAKVPAGTVRHWRYKGWLNADGRRRYVDVEDRGYRIGDVLDAAEDTALSPQSHRRAAA